MSAAAEAKPREARSARRCAIERGRRREVVMEFRSKEAAE